MISKILRTLTLITFLFAVSGSTALAKLPVLDIEAIDTIAGFGTTIEVSKTLPGEDVNFVLRHPGTKKEVFSVLSDDSGVALLDIDGSDLRKAGLYSVSVQVADAAKKEASFVVYPDEVSSGFSQAVTSNRSVGLGDTVLLTVKLKDKYGNAIKGHQATVVSSREDDIIDFASSKTYTNSNGEITFEVSSNEPGVSVYSVFDVTSGKILKSRPNVYYATEYSRLSSAGGDFDDMVAVSGGVSFLAIEEIPENVAPNKNISFTVTAYDESGETASGYTGTVHMSALGDNGNLVELPEADYTFSEDDIGTHTYSLGLKFLQEGTYLIEARDVDDFGISGELEVVVGSGSTPSGSKKISEEYEFEFSSPITGTYGGSIQTLSGKAPPGYTVGIYDKDEEFGVTEADNDGNFSFETTPLASGEHVFVAVLLDENSEVLQESDPVTITIDVAAPVVDQISFSPESDIPASSTVTVNIHSEENLSAVKVSFGGQTFELQADPKTPTLYVGTIQAPKSAGAYDVSVTLKDSLGNEASYDAQATLTVTDPLHPAGLDSELPSGVATVTGLSAVPQNSKITLVWTPAVSPVGIKNYRVYYGLAADQLTYAVDTLTSDPTWYIPNLQNDVKYYFAVTAINNLGAESPAMSAVLEATPFATEAFQGLEPVQTAPSGYYYYPYMPAQTGPDALWAVFISILASFGYFGFKKRGFLK